jgi:hypothetical protein
LVPQIEKRIPGGLSNIKSLMLKTDRSISLPLLQQWPDENTWQFIPNSLPERKPSRKPLDADSEKKRQADEEFMKQVLKKIKLKI